MFKSSNKKRSGKMGGEKYNQHGGASDWWHSFNAWHMSPAELSRYTLQYIDNAPMFNPLATCGTIIPTGTSGITPTGVYLANHPSKDVKSNDYNVSLKGKQPLRGTPPCNCAHTEHTEQNGAGMNELGYSQYPGCPSTTIPDYQGINYGVGCNSCRRGCGLMRYKPHYSATRLNYNTSCNKSGCSDCLKSPCGGPCNRDGACKQLYANLMQTDQQKLWALCEDNNVSIYNMDMETGRLTPQSKDKLCQRLAKAMM